MNPRIFCRERTYHKALLLTYSFDPIFFEQIVLPDLWAGRTGDILAIGDRDQVLEATATCAGQLWHLGRSYLLGSANHDGAFHPKVILRLGANDGAILIGSGNLTSSGWGGNQELGTGWLLGPGHLDDGAWIHSFLTDVLSWCGSDLERDAVSRMRDTSWLSLGTESSATSSVLYSRHDMPLATSLARRWVGRRFDSVRILTGSTDESGAFLRWAHATFGVRRAIVALTPASVSFDPRKLADLPIELSLIAAPTDRPMHAKLYWFEGENGAAAVMGSANCSAAAWLLPPNQGGNIETVVVYDAVTEEQYEDVLRVFDAPASNPQELLGTKSEPSPELPATVVAFRLLGLRWDRDTELMTAVISPRPGAEHAVELLLGSRVLPMAAPNHPDGHWTIAMPENSVSGTLFGRARITRDSESWTTAARWVDDLAGLRHASHSVRLLEPFNGLERGTTSAEQRQILGDLQEVAHALFSDTAAFRDSVSATVREKQTRGEPAAPPVDPTDLVCHLDEDPDNIPSLGDAYPRSLSISGILRMLFDAEVDGPGVAVSTEDEQLDEDMTERSSDDKDKQDEPKQNPREDARPIEERFRERLATQISTFLAGLRSSDFAERCSATQMVQAVAFPLAVALRGQKRGWVSAQLAEAWGLEIMSILFRGTGASAGSLLHAVEQRYLKNGQGEIFNDVVGDGILWMVLVSTLGGSHWRGPGTYLDKAVALREVFTSKQLLASARPERIAGLLGKIRIDDARKHLAEIAPAVTKLLGDLESRLLPIWADMAKAQTERLITHRTGDLLWRDNVGWAVCLEDNALENKIATRVRLKGLEKNVVAGFYVNVSELAARDSDLNQQLAELRSCTSSDTETVA